MSYLYDADYFEKCAENFCARGRWIDAERLREAARTIRAQDDIIEDLKKHCDSLRLKLGMSLILEENNDEPMETL